MIKSKFIFYFKLKYRRVYDLDFYNTLVSGVFTIYSLENRSNIYIYKNPRLFFFLWRSRKTTSFSLYIKTLSIWFVILTLTKMEQTELSYIYIYIYIYSGEFLFWFKSYTHIYFLNEIYCHTALPFCVKILRIKDFKSYKCF